MIGKKVIVFQGPQASTMLSARGSMQFRSMRLPSPLDLVSGLDKHYASSLWPDECPTDQGVSRSLLRGIRDRLKSN